MLSFVNKIVKVQSRKFVRSSYRVLRTLQYKSIETVLHSLATKTGYRRKINMSKRSLWTFEGHLTQPHLQPSRKRRKDAMWVKR